MKESVKSLYPSTKLWLVAFIIISSLTTSSYIYQISMIVFIFVLSAICGELKSVVGSLFKGLTLLILFAFIMQAVLIDHENSKIVFEVAFIKVSDIGLINAFGFTLKIIVMSASILWYFKTTQIKDIAYALESGGCSKKVSFVVMSVFQIMEQLKSKSKTIMQAQMSRGIETEGNIIVRMKSLIPVIIPLILSTLESSDERVLTLEARAFSSTKTKTNLYYLEYKKSDKTLKYVFIVLFLVSLVVNIFMKVRGL